MGFIWCSFRPTPQFVGDEACDGANDVRMEEPNANVNQINPSIKKRIDYLALVDILTWIVIVGIQTGNPRHTENRTRVTGS